MLPHSPRARRSALLLVALVLGLTAACSSATGGSRSTTAGQTSGGAPSAGSGRSYVALGDSYSSAPLVPTTDVADGCFRSSNNYASLVAKALPARLVDRTCGGAQTRDLLGKQYPAVPPQLDALRPTTDLVTIGIGGNDAGVFTSLVGQCSQLAAQDPEGHPCRTAMSSSGRDRLLTALDGTRKRVTQALVEVKQRSPEAQVLVVGYPQIISADSRCRQLPLAAGDYAYAERVNARLASAVQQAAAATGTTYVDVWKASQGHDICAKDPWINGATDDKRRAARFHPFAVEQRAVAKLVEQAVASRG